MHVSGILYYLSTCINPILCKLWNSTGLFLSVYNFGSWPFSPDHIMSNKFRQAFKVFQSFANFL